MGICYASVRIIDAVLSADKEYLYMVTPELIGEVKQYCFVTVPFGMSNKQMNGLIVSLTDKCDLDLIKPITSVISYLGTISEEQYKMCRFISDRAFCTFGAALRTVMAPITFGMPKAVFEIAAELPKNESEIARTVYSFIEHHKFVTEKKLQDAFSQNISDIKRLLLKGIIKESLRYDIRCNEKTVVRVYLDVSEEEAQRALDLRGMLTPKQRAALEAVLETPGIVVRDLYSKADVGITTVAGLEKRGFIRTERERVDREYGIKNDNEPYTSFTLSDEQLSASNELCGMMDSGKPGAALLYGVTGSGKTKVIISVVKHALARGKGALILTPEIGLSSQALSLFKKEFGDKAAVIHSMLSEGERHDTNKRIESGEISVVLGTRSAVFAPMKNIGVIAIDEEQESTYKSERTPKYHAKDVARFRCAYHNALMLLASATPSVESMFKAVNSQYRLITLKNRYNGTELPKVDVVDLRSDERAASGKLLSSELCAKLKAVVARDDQAILYIGRRGHNSYISCRSCGYVYSCPNCSVSLTYHAYCGDGKQRLICHYCGYSEIKPTKCRNCGSEHIGYFGYGTQLLQDELDELLGKDASIRMDADTTAVKYSHEEILSAFKKGKARVLFGTQMVAKGLDFPNVTLVGLVQTDSTLYMSDFRSSERTFSLITQLMGRAGRAEKRGEAIIQTYSPDHEVIRLGAEQNYEKYFENEIKLRKAVIFPPFCSIAVLSVSSESENDLIQTSKRLDKELTAMIMDNKDKVAFLKFGPCREGIYRLNGLYRQRIIIKYRDGKQSREALRTVYGEFLKHISGDTKIDIDVNPTIV